MESISKNWLDVSESISKNTVVWPGDPQAIVSQLASHELGDDYQLSEAFFSLHTGTHIDAPLHFIKDGKDVTQIPSSSMMGDVLVMDVTNENKITAEYLKRQDFQNCERIFFKTISDEMDRKSSLEKNDFIALDVSAANYLREKKIKLIGIDGLSIAIADELKEVHVSLLEKEIVIVEVLNLQEITAGIYEMICLPIKIAGAEAAPARVLLRKK